MAAIERIASGGPWEVRFGYSRAVRAGDLVLVAGTTAIDEDGVVRGVGDAGAQTAFALDRIEAALAQAGATLAQVVRTRMYVTDASRADEIGRVHGERFAGHRRRPAWSRSPPCSTPGCSSRSRPSPTSEADGQRLQPSSGSVRCVTHTAPLVLVLTVIA